MKSIPTVPTNPIADAQHESEKSFSSGLGGAPALAGQPLPATIRHEMETQFGADFSSVRIHEGVSTVHTGALAYTQGSDIHFAPGMFDPHSSAGRELLGHELSHVVQQGQGSVRNSANGAGATASGAAAGIQR